MCIIVDTNTFHKFKEPDDEDMEPAWTWLENRDGKIAYVDLGKLEEEWDKGGMPKLRNRLRQTGKLKVVPPEDVQEKANELADKIASNDAHILALALIAEVKVLVSYREGDRNLFDDFKDKNLIGGKVYTRKQHAHLLTKDTCP